MTNEELFSRLQEAYGRSGCVGFGHFVATCAAFYGKDVRLLDNSDLVTHAECYSRALQNARDGGKSNVIVSA